MGEGKIIISAVNYIWILKYGEIIKTCLANKQDYVISMFQMSKDIKNINLPIWPPINHIKWTNIWKESYLIAT